ncbi:MAG: PDZ domain-containing protein [Vicingaceae bacterium]|nr:PDZ domain-containing protein [Vicingaceae bacterium]
MKYIVSYQQATNHFIDIEFIAENSQQQEEITVQLPAWRPGRYELANFAKNIQKWQAFNEKGKPLNFEKITKDTWKVFTNKAKKIHIKYNYYANEINAGSSYLDENQLYINGVNCFLYIPEQVDTACKLELKLPKDYQVATGLKSKSKHQFEAKDFHELVDCPFIASNSLKHHAFEESNVLFHMWFQGECKPDFKKLENDFKKFCKKQIKDFGSFLVSEYHFLFQILTYRTYHGVEHSNSTVISLGPSYEIMDEKGWYNELLGVSSHELYHTWNVKQIRPIEMYPYDYTKENYTVLGYLDEGVTTYFGDKYLFTSGVFDWTQYKNTFDKLLERHYTNFGVENLSVASSSFDTWLDGYVRGIPNRKGSIYTEGALVAFITDIFIMKNTNNKKGLKDVMKILYTDFAKKGKGVSDVDYKTVVEKVAGASYDKIYTALIHGVKDFTPWIKDAAKYIGCELKITPSNKYNEAKFGFKVRYENNSCIVDNVAPQSVAEKLGLAVGDEILAINNIKLANDLEQWSNYFGDDKQTITIKRALGKIEAIDLKLDKKIYFNNYELLKQNEKAPNFKEWSKK